FRDHGKPRPSLTENVEGASRTMKALADTGISMKEVTDKLVAEGVQQFADAFQLLIKAADRRCASRSTVKIDRQTFRLPKDLESAVKATLEDWKKADNACRLWRHDASLWTGADESKWLGWLDITDDQLSHMEHFNAIAQEMKSEGFRHAL